MSFHDARRLRIAPPTPEARADALATIVCRSAMAALSHGEAAWSETGWRALIAEMPSAEARAMFARFDRFARTLLAAAERPLEWRPAASRCLSNDEAQMLRMIAAAQCSDFCRMDAIAGRLLCGDDLSAALEATQALAGALAARGLFVSDR
jgi:hypothetical protein